jgi:hypothetical protein
VGEARQRGRIPALPTESVALAEAHESLGRAMKLTVAAAGRANDIEQAASVGDAPAVIGFVAGGVLGAMALDALASANVESARSQTQDSVWALEREIDALVRRLMVLHELGFPIAKAMQPLVTTHAPVGGSKPRLRALHEHLGYLRTGVEVWLSEPG